jgi:NADH:ubiquinone oxidoreductase subunit 6 (subunit J)
LAIIFVMVYVGAIMVLFLFAIMLLNFREQAIEANNSVLFYLVIISFFLLVYFFVLQYVN